MDGELNPDSHAGLAGLDNHLDPGQDDQYITTFFCRAMYSYQSQDASSLSFQKDDIIEVLTQLDSGWWDGLLRDERGWFPSNYVEVVSDEEAEAALSGPDLSPPSSQNQDDSANEVSHSMNGAGSESEPEWPENEFSTDLVTPSQAPKSEAQPNDFWVPRVDSSGQIYFLNTQTGQHSRDLPQEADDEASEGELAVLASQQSSRSGTSMGLGLSSSANTSEQDLHRGSGFGLPKRTNTPEPWVRRLADDGVSYYYWNKNTGQIEWTLPTSEVEASAPSLTVPHTNGNGFMARNQPRGNGARHSIYSDDSDVQPADWDTTTTKEPKKPNRYSIANTSQYELTSSEKLAGMLQQALLPPPPEFIGDLTTTVLDGIAKVVDYLHTNGSPHRADEYNMLDTLVCLVVQFTRNLLYVSAIPTGSGSTSLDSRLSSAMKAFVKPAQRKVTATLSKLVLSARAMQYDSGPSSDDMSKRIEADAEELERAVAAFKLEMDRCQSQAAYFPEPKRLTGIFSTANIGLGLIGGGAAGSWKGFGFVALPENETPPETRLASEVLTRLRQYVSQVTGKLEETIGDLGFRFFDKEHRGIIGQLSSLLAFINNIHIARHVDIDGMTETSVPNDDLYLQTVEQAQSLLRGLERSVQSLYDDSMALFLKSQIPQTFSDSELQPGRTTASIIGSIISDLRVVEKNLGNLLAVGQHQADFDQSNYSGSIGWRLSRMSLIDGQFTSSSPSSEMQGGGHMIEFGEDDLVKLEDVFGGQKPADPAESWIDASTINGSEHQFGHTKQSSDSGSPDPRHSISASTLKDSMEDLDDELSANKSQSRPTGSKIFKIFGPGVLPPYVVNTIANESMPWYRRPNYRPGEIIIEPDGAVKGGTVAALVERLTAHEHGDQTFSKVFLMTYKSFTTLDELFDLLIQRFWVQPPEGLNQTELEDWSAHKQFLVQSRVLNTFKSMVVDDDVLEKEDFYILDKMKEFICSDQVIKHSAAKGIIGPIERAQQRGRDAVKTMISTHQGPPPPPIIPKTTKKLKLLDVDPLELARQLTILESQLYQKIRPMECLVRSREQKAEHNDNIATVIQTSNRIADWVAESILSREDSRRRAAVVKHFIIIADRCRFLHNFSTMVAITSGLNTPPIRRLKRTWEQINAKLMAQLGACEMTIDSNKNFNTYRQTLNSISPPCVPFIGVFLTILQFIQDGSKDDLPGNLINFRKRQKAAEVIQDIKRWQSHPYNLTPIPTVLAYIDDSLKQFNDTVDIRDHFWNLSLEREPRERDDEKMARLLQESGFL